MEHYHITDYSFVRLSFGKSCISIVYPTPLISWKILVHTDMTKVNVVMDVQPINMQHIHDHISRFITSYNMLYWMHPCLHPCLFMPNSDLASKQKSRLIRPGNVFSNLLLSNFGEFKRTVGLSFLFLAK